jgi:short-chain fatty acids transporter
MLRGLGEFFTRLSQRFIPDAFVFAILLTFVVYVLGMIFTPNGPFAMIQHWYKGFWELLAFAMQMVLILVTGYMLATAPLVRRGLVWLAAKPRSTGQAAWMVAFVAIILAWISWGLGLIAGAVLAREVAASGRRRGIPIHYPLVAASGYLGLAIWHGGLTGSAPLLVNTPKHFLEDKIGLVALSQTIFTPFNIFVVVALLIIWPFMMAAMVPAKKDIEEADDTVLGDLVPQPVKPRSLGAAAYAERLTVARRLEESRLLIWLIGLGGLIYVAWFFANRGLDLNLDIVNFTFLMVGLLLHGTPIAYAAGLREGVKTAGAVVLQFPFYAGIMGMMKYSGLIAVVAGWFVAISTPITYPFWTFVSAALINLAVPSGGGQWAVQGPIMIEAAKQLNVPIARTIMAVAYGDQLTNLIQPFWALPLLGLTGLNARQIMGYTALALFVGFVVMTAGLLLFP